jgi:hypothetical protein
MSILRNAYATCLVIGISAGSAMAASFELSPNTDLSALTVGDVFSVDLVFDPMGGPGLTGFGLNMNFDETVVDYVDTTFDPNHTWFTAISGQRNMMGYDVFGVMAGMLPPNMMGPGGSPIDTRSTVATMNFEAVGDGSTMIDFPAMSPMGFGQVDFAAAVDPAALLSVDVTVAPTGVIPLPATLPLLLAGLGGLAALRRR